MKKLPALITFFCILIHAPVISAGSHDAPAHKPDLKLEAKSALLMEASTGTVLFEKNPHKKMRPASITKIMTLLLIFESVEQNRISLTDTVTVSAHAASMGGSQVFLEENETQTVDDLIKCISIASANDACVAMAEHIAGSEDAFVELMNKKAESLGMNDTTFVNCCGLEAEGHLTSAYDIALMARELTVSHPKIYDYCTIWMDKITHHTKKGDSEFGLTNTNKLIRYYSYATGLKTGYTGQSKYCLAATAKKDDLNLIAVVMAEPNPTTRNAEAISLCNYGFANCRIYLDENKKALPDLPVEKGTDSHIPIKISAPFRFVLTDGSGNDSVTRTVVLPEQVCAPVKKGRTLGSVEYAKDGKVIGSVPIIAEKSIDRRTLGDTVHSLFNDYFTITEKTTEG